MLGQAPTRPPTDQVLKRPEPRRRDGGTSAQDHGDMAMHAHGTVPNFAAWTACLFGARPPDLFAGWRCRRCCNSRGELVAKLVLNQRPITRRTAVPYCLAHGIMTWDSSCSLLLSFSFPSYLAFATTRCTRSRCFQKICFWGGGARIFVSARFLI